MYLCSKLDHNIPLETSLRKHQIAANAPPELAVIERLDKVAMETRGLAPQMQEKPLPVITEVQLPTDIQAFAEPGEAIPYEDEIAHGKELEGELPVEISQTLTQANMHNLGDLDLGVFESTLTMDSWTVELLAEAEIGDLTGYPRIGEVRAKVIIDQAKELINRT